MRLHRLLALGLVLLLALMLCACSSDDEDLGGEEPEGPDAELAENTEYPLWVGGAEVRSRPLRVVSLAPALTEKIAELGYADRLMGVSDYCDHPTDVVPLPRYGTAQFPDVSMLRELDPHVIFAEDTLDDEVLAELAGLDVAVVVLPHATGIASLEEMYISIATVMEGKVTGQMIGEQFVERNLRLRLDALPSPGGGAPGLYLRALSFTVATGDTLEGELLERLGYTNIARDQSDFYYEGAESEDGVAAFRSVEMILMDPEYVTITHLEQSDYYKSLPATIQDRYVYIDSLLFERQSLRLLDELERIAVELREFD